MGTQRPNTVGLLDKLISYLATLVTICILGLLIMIFCYSVCVAFLYNSDGVSEAVRVQRLDIIKTVALDSLRASLGSVLKDLPWPSGVVIARIQGRLPNLPALWFHVGINAVIFSLIGLIAGRVRLPYICILVPALVFFQTYAFMKSEFFTLLPLNLIPICAVFLMQIMAMSGAAYFARQTTR